MMEKHFFCEDCELFPDTIIEKNDLRIVRHWDGEEYERVDGDGGEKVYECEECGSDLVDKGGEIDARVCDRSEEQSGARP